MLICFHCMESGTEHLCLLGHDHLNLNASEIQHSFELRILPHRSLIAECLDMVFAGVRMEGVCNVRSPAKCLHCQEDMCYRLERLFDGIQSTALK